MVHWGPLATNRWLQPEMLGRSGLLDLQAGPRRRLVLQPSTASERRSAADSPPDRGCGRAPLTVGDEAREAVWRDVLGLVLYSRLIGAAARLVRRGPVR